MKVYNRPASEFVARFMGSHNVIGPRRQGKAPTLQIAPQQAELPWGAQRMLAVVTDVEYQGAYVLVGLQKQGVLCRPTPRRPIRSCLKPPFAAHSPNRPGQACNCAGRPTRRIRCPPLPQWPWLLTARATPPLFSIPSPSATQGVFPCPIRFPCCSLSLSRCSGVKRRSLLTQARRASWLAGMFPGRACVREDRAGATRGTAGEPWQTSDHRRRNPKADAGTSRSSTMAGDRRRR